jgi:hypothetical protein
MYAFVIHTDICDLSNREFYKINPNREHCIIHDIPKMKTLPVRKMANQEFPLSVAAASIGWILFIQFFGVGVINEKYIVY